jgi:hypothetical protein
MEVVGKALKLVWSAERLLQCQKVLYTFTGREDGASPISGLIFDMKGNLYGTASAGGSVACIGGEAIGCGRVFELTWVGGTGDCNQSNGNGCGVVFEITP